MRKTIKMPGVFRRCPLRICIDQSEHQDWYGRLLSPDFGVCPFWGLVEMLALIDQYYDALGLPQKEMRLRSFCKDAEGFVQRNLPALEPRREGVRRGIGRSSGELATVDIALQARRNASWQGLLQWREGKRRQHFSSVLEVLRFINWVLEQGRPLLAQNQMQSPESLWQDQETQHGQLAESIFGPLDF